MIFFSNLIYSLSSIAPRRNQHSVRRRSTSRRLLSPLYQLYHRTNVRNFYHIFYPRGRCNTFRFTTFTGRWLTNCHCERDTNSYPIVCYYLRHSSRWRRRFVLEYPSQCLASNASRLCFWCLLDIRLVIHSHVNSSASFVHKHFLSIDTYTITTCITQIRTYRCLSPHLFFGQFLRVSIPDYLTFK